MRDNVITFETNDLEFLGTSPEKNVTVILKGAIGSSFKLTSEVSFTLTLRNPCINTTFIEIIPRDLPAIESYLIYEDFRIVQLNQFSISVFPGEDPEICGQIGYQLQVNGEEINRNSRPIAFDSNSLRVFIMSESLDDVGVKNLTMSAFLQDFPE